MKTTNEIKKFIRLRNIIVAALLAIMLTLAGCAGTNAVVDLSDTEATAGTDGAAVSSFDESQAGIDESAAATGQPDVTDGTETLTCCTPTPAPAVTQSAPANGSSATTAKPTAAATAKPGTTPTAKPATTPTVKPTATATAKPTTTPTAKPTAAATAKPTATPTQKPSSGNPLFGNFSAKDVKGNTVTNSIFSGYDVTMVNIWASYCGPCAEEMPDLAALNSEYKSQGFQVVGIILDAADSSGNVDNSALSDAKDVISKTGANYTNIIPSSSMFSKYLSRISSVPTTVFVNSDGEIIGSAYTGSKSKAKWASIIEEKLG